MAALRQPVACLAWTCAIQAAKPLRAAAGFWFAIAGASAAEGPLPEFTPAAEKSAILSETIREASGLAVSTRDGGYMWVVNDSGSAPTLHLIETSGMDRGQVTLRRAANVDWEDLVSFSIDGTSYLMVADTGDNDARRETCTLYVLREPALPETGKNLAQSAGIEWQIQFRYEGGPRDCEAVAVDVPRKKILLLSKRTDPPEIHELPLMPQEKRGILVTHKTGITRVSAPVDNLVPFRNQPTGLDITADNSLAAVVTYYGVFLFPRTPAESWSEAFARKPAILSPHCLAQAESVAFSKDGNSIRVVSEGRNSRIVRYQRQLKE